MKVKALSRSSRQSTRECVGDVKKVSRNLNPNHHPMQKAREYTRAVTSAKLERMFAKPLCHSLEGHTDGVMVTCPSRNSLRVMVSGSADGEVRVWDLASQKGMVAYTRAHNGWVTGLVENPSASESPSFYSCGMDGYVKLWDMNGSGRSSDDPEADGLLNTWRYENGSLKCIDHHWTEEQFATASDHAVDLWNPNRATPIQSFSLWGTDSVNVVKYNPSERCLLAHCSSDRGIGLHDVRVNLGLRKTLLSMRSNCLEWNPMEPQKFVVGNEDFNAYSFDIRKLNEPYMIHKGHVMAVMSVAWAPTGREFVTGSYDKTIRIFGLQSGTAREIYHTKRMQRVYTVNYSTDNRYIVSGSDDTNLRVWKARASDKIGQLTPREERSIHYRKALVKKYKHMPEVHNISKHRKVPALIKKKTSIFHIQKASAQRKQVNRVKHSKPGTVGFKNERKTAIVKEIE
mmetsp:Transcript_6489/g.9483  ORF Transcript_6489/g.9483 Transcript_6489/m.9483 type:complete len:457 (+) Transcript_6489:62-1432(+)